MFNRLTIALLAATLGVGPSTVLAQDDARRLQLTFDPSGLVTLDAQNVTAREVLAEWARQCNCLIVNADKLMGQPMDVPIQFTQAPQAKVLDSLLREAAGYALTPRRAGSAGPSHFETIYILATGTSSPEAAAAYIPYEPPAPVMPPLPTAGSPDDELPPVVPVIQPRDPSDAPEVEQLPPSQPVLPGSGVFIPIVPIGPVPMTQPQGQVPGTTPPVPDAPPGNQRP